MKQKIKCKIFFCIQNIMSYDLSQPIYLKLKEMISNGELKQGEKIAQEKIAEKLGVSRTPLMKALLALENEYLVESIPRRGIYLRSLDQKNIDIYTCREAIEGMAARLLVDKKDHSKGASNEAYIEAMPDTGVAHKNKLITG